MAKKNEIEKSKPISLDTLAEETQQETTGNAVQDAGRAGNSSGDVTPEQPKKETGRKVETDILSNLEAFTETPSIDELHPVKKRRRKKTDEPAQPEQKQFVIPGKLALTVIDNAACMGLTVLDKWQDKNSKMTPEMLSMTVQQREDLVPLAEEAFKQMGIGSDPVTAFFGSLGMIYLTNYMAVKQTLKIKTQHEKNSN